jgi:ribosomal protein S7
MRLARHSNAFFRLHDRFYASSYISQIVKILMSSGNFSIVSRLINTFLLELKKKYKQKNILLFINEIFDKYRPLVSFLDRKVAATKYTLPWFISIERSRSLIVRWFVKSALERTEIGVLSKLIGEFEDLSKGMGRTVKRVEEYYALAKRNRPFMRFIKKKKSGRSSRLKKFGLTNVSK